MQLIAIFQTLSKTELAALKQVVESHHRASLTALFGKLAQLADTQQPYDSVSVFEEVFGQPFEKSKNYLLYNEVRNLKQITNNYLVAVELEAQQADEDIYAANLLKAYSKRKLDELFYSHIDKALAKAEDTFNSSFICQLYGLKHRHLIAKSFESPMPEEAHITMLQKWQHEEVKRLKYIIREQESEMAYLKRAQAIKKDYLEAVDLNLSFQPLDYISLAETDEPRSRYLELTRDQFLYRGAKRVQASRENLALLHSLNYKIPNRHEEEIDVMFNLSSALISIHEFEEALAYLKKCVTYAAEYKVAQPESVHEMQIRCHIHMGNYQLGIDHFETHITEIRKTAYYISTVTIVCMCHLFLNDSRSAVMLALQLLSPSPRVELISRYIRIIAFIIDRDLDQAGRELANLKRSKTFKAKKSAWPIVVKFYDKLLDAYQSTAKAKKEKLAKLNQEIAKEKASLEIIDLTYLWIKRHVRTL